MKRDRARIDLVMGDVSIEFGWVVLNVGCEFVYYIL